MTERIEWALVASNGTTIKVKDVSFERDMSAMPDADNPGWIIREPVGPVRVTAVVIGTEPEEKIAAGQPPA